MSEGFHAIGASDHLYPHLEPGARDGAAYETVQLSIAISLKRIADALGAGGPLHSIAQDASYLAAHR